MTRPGVVRNTASIAGESSPSDTGEARDLRVRRVDEEEVDALFAEPGEGAQVGYPAVEGELVHLEVAGVQDEAGGGADRDGEPVGDRVVDGDELAVEGAEGASVVLAHLHGDRGDAVLLELRLEEREREAGADDGDVRPLAQQVGHAADVVLVAVREHDRVDLVETVPDPGEVGQDHVDAGLVLLGEEDAAVDDEQPAGVLEDRHVAADLAQTAQGNDPQAVARQRGEVLGRPPGAASPPTRLRAGDRRPRSQAAPGTGVHGLAVRAGGGLLGRWPGGCGEQLRCHGDPSRAEQRLGGDETEASDAHTCRARRRSGRHVTACPVPRLVESVGRILRPR